jgi:hypothetical protein
VGPLQVDRLTTLLDRRAVGPLWLSSLEEQLPFEPAHVGSYWSSTAEFDAVLLDEERRRAFVVEVKWRKGPANVALLDDLRSRVGKEAAFDGLETTYALVSRGGFHGHRPERADERLVDVSRLKAIGQG